MSRQFKAASVDALFVDSAQAMVVRVHPIVLFSVLDHYNRRPEHAQRVVGTLLGTVAGSVVEIRDSFGVPHREDGDEVALGQDYHRAMYQLFSRINDKERIVGWYSTSLPNGQSLNHNSIVLHHFYSTTAASETAQGKLVHLVMDTSVTNSTIAVRAYVSTNVQVAGASVANIFHQVKVEIVSSEPERVCIDRMVKGQDIERAWSSSETLATVESSTDDLEAAVTSLLEMLESVSGFVDRVVDGEEESDSSVGCQIADALSSVPRIRPELFDSIFNSNLQDMLMISYLASLTKANLAISEKLNAVARAPPAPQSSSA